MEDTGSGGAVTNEWVSYLVSVSSGSINAYVDGEAVAPGAYAFSDRRMNFDNIAW